MRVLVCQAQDICPIGNLGPPLERAGAELVTWLADSEPPPTLEGIAGLVALGGGASPTDDGGNPWLEDTRSLLREALARELPTVGICLGAQLLAQVGGGLVKPLDRAEIGWVELTSESDGSADLLYSSMPARHVVFEWHSYGFTLPRGAELLAGTPEAVQAFRLGSAWGLQYHVEASEPIVAGWIDHYDATLRAGGRTPARLRRETARRAATQGGYADALGAAFARVVRTRAPFRTGSP